MKSHIYEPPLPQTEPQTSEGRKRAQHALKMLAAMSGLMAGSPYADVMNPKNASLALPMKEETNDAI